MRRAGSVMMDEAGDYLYNDLAGVNLSSRFAQFARSATVANAFSAPLNMTNKPYNEGELVSRLSHLLRHILTFSIIVMAVLAMAQWVLLLPALRAAEPIPTYQFVLLGATVGFALVLVYARWLAAQNRNASAVTVLFISICLTSAVVVISVPSALGLALIAPAFGLIVALPFVGERAARWLKISTVALGLLLVPVSAWLAPMMPAPTTSSVILQSLPLILALVAMVLLVGQLRDWLISTLYALRDSRNTLEANVDERTRELQAVNQSLRRQTIYLESLHETALGIMNRQHREQLFEDVITRACRQFDTPHAFLALLSEDGSAMVSRIARGFFLQQEREPGDRLITHRGTGVVGMVWETGMPLAIEDYATWPGRLSDVPVGAVKSVMSAPLMRGGQVVGVICIAGEPEHCAFGKDDLEFLCQLAHLVSIAVDNTLLFEAARSNELELEQVVAERTAELSALLGVAQHLSATLDLPALLQTIFQQLDCLIEYDAGTIFEVQGELLVTLHYAGPRHSSFKAGTNWRLSGHHLEIVRTSQPIIINDVHGDEPMARLFRETSKNDWLGDVPEHIVSWIGVPMKVKDHVIGILTLDSTRRHHFNERHAELLTAVAQQAALAIENARLYTQATRSAAQAERSRLARDLHDSVSQAIYGIVLASRTLEKLADPDDSRVVVPLQHILSLSDAAMAEIRALIFELRPESLEREGVLAALNKQADAVRARYGLTVHVELVRAEPAIPLAVKEAIYRIAQEAMHNVVKHAHARQVWLSLSGKSETFVLEVRDDGVGFDVNRAWAGQMGLGTMRERAQSVGGTLEVESSLQRGVLIRAVIPMRMAIAGT